MAKAISFKDMDFEFYIMAGVAGNFDEYVLPYALFNFELADANEIMRRLRSGESEGQIVLSDGRVWMWKQAKPYGPRSPDDDSYEMVDWSRDSYWD